MRAVVVAGLGGLLIGHVLWLAGISVAGGTTTVNAWVLVVAAVSLLLGIAGALLGWNFYRAKAFAKAAFLWALPISPVLLSVAVIGVTYL